VLIFVSTQCPNVKIYDSRINDIANEYQAKGFVIWGINSNSTEPVEDVKQHSVDVNYNFPVLKDMNNTVADMLGATKTPEVFVIDKNRVVLYHGRIDDNRDISSVTSNDLKNALNDILASKDIAVKSTKSFGCTIKRVDK
jgi:peroxiredoxin